MSPMCASSRTGGTPSRPLGERAPASSGPRSSRVYLLSCCSRDCGITSGAHAARTCPERRLGQEGRARRGVRPAGYFVAVLDPCRPPFYAPWAVASSGSAQPSNAGSVAHDPETPPPAARERQLEHVVDGDHAHRSGRARRPPAASRGCSRSSGAPPRAGRRRSRPTRARARRRPRSVRAASARSSVTTNTEPTSAAVVVEQVDGRERARAARSLDAHALDRVRPPCPSARDADEVGAHQPAGGRGVVAEQRFDLAPLRRRQQREDAARGDPGRSPR